MKYYSTNGTAPMADLKKAVVKGLAEDRGLYMPEQIKTLPKVFFDNIQDMSFRDIAYNVAAAFFGEDIDGDALQDIVYDTLSFDCPIVKVTDNIYSLELFHGPTLAFKDVGARFMARMSQYLLSENTSSTSPTSDTRAISSTSSTRATGSTRNAHPVSSAASIKVLVATSGDTGSAVANGFLGVEGIDVYVLYPKGKVSPIQECQFTTLGQNITAVEVDGVFDDCQALVKSAFMDAELNSRMRLTSANSINVARFLPQAFYYFNAYAQLRRQGKADDMVVCVPSGNFGNICAGLFAKRMGLPVKHFIAANNANDVFYQFLQTGQYMPRPSIQTIANAMDVGDPSNFARIYDLYAKDWKAIRADISGATYTDGQIADTMRQVYKTSGYVCDPHGACGFRALSERLQTGETGVFLETAHPAKFKQTVDGILDADIEIPEKLQAFMKGKKQCVAMQADFNAFKQYLLGEQ